MKKNANYRIFLLVFVFLITQASAIEVAVTTSTDNSYLHLNSQEVNISIFEPNLDGFKFNWNQTNYSFYDSSLVLAMNFNNNTAIGEKSTKVIDISKYRNNGTVYGATWTTNGRFGGAMGFDGVDDYVKIPSPKIESGSFTIEVWINPTRTETDNYGTILAYDSTHRLLLGAVSGDLRAYFGGVFYSNSKLNANQWAHVIYMYNASNNIEYWYINGNHDAEHTPTSTPVWNASFQIGKYSSGSYNFHGLIDELHIWNRTLSPSEIKMHYQSEFQKYNSTEWKFYVNISWSPCGTGTFGCNINPLGEPIGGGAGYSKIVLNNSNVDFLINSNATNLTQFKNALKNSKPGDIIYINDSVEMNLTTEKNLIIPAGVTIASGRGNGSSKGALLYFNKLNYTKGSIEEYYLFLGGGNGSRVTGLRLRGCDGTTRTAAYEYSTCRAITTEYQIEIDNNELYNWSKCAVCLYGKFKLNGISLIRHNYIHNNMRTENGYGVSHAEWGKSITEGNIFDWNRHSIASDGYSGSDYTARYNLVLSNGTGHSFDVHGGIDRADGTNISGGTINIYGNTFNRITNNNLSGLNYYTSFPTVKIRGVPTKSANIYNNYLYYDPQENPIQQINAIGNMNIYNNCYNMYTDHIEDGTYTYYGWASDIAGNSNRSKINLVTVNKTNKAPIISLFPSNGSIFNETDNIHISINASDPDNDSLSFNIKIDDLQVSTSPNYIWNNSNYSPGYHIINVSISDGKITVSTIITIYINNVYLRYDVDKNGILNINDLVKTMEHINEINVAPYSIYDMNLDGIVDILDITIVSQHIGETL